jgi:hypothetical protein
LAGWLRTGPDLLGQRGQQFGHSWPSRLPKIPPMTRTPIRTTRRVAGRLAVATMTAMLTASSDSSNRRRRSAGTFLSAPCRHSDARASSIGGGSRLATRSAAEPCGRRMGFEQVRRHALLPGLPVEIRRTYPVTFSQCNKTFAFCYNPRREFRNCEFRHPPGSFPPRRIRCPPKLCFLVAGKYRSRQQPSRTHRSPDVASSPILLNSLILELFACQGHGRPDPVGPAAALPAAVLPAVSVVTASPIGAEAFLRLCTAPTPICVAGVPCIYLSLRHDPARHSCGASYCLRN